MTLFPLPRYLFKYIYACIFVYANNRNTIYMMKPGKQKKCIGNEYN